MKKINTRTQFLAGLVVLIPIAVSIWLLSIVINLLSTIGFVLPADWQFQALPIPLKAVFVIAATIVFVVGISFLGWASTNYFGKLLLNLLQRLMVHIPVLGTIYSSLDQLLRTLMSGNSSQFRRVVYLEFPKKGTWAVGFVTGTASTTALNNGTPGNFLNVFVPTVPNPTSGFHMLVHESEVKDTHMTVEQAFKNILSLGIAQPVITTEPRKP